MSEGKAPYKVLVMYRKNIDFELWLLCHIWTSIVATNWKPELFAR